MKAHRLLTASRAGALAALLLVVGVPTARAQSYSASSDQPASWDAMHRRFSTRDGSSGGLSLADASTGEVGSLRLQLVLSSFPADDFLTSGVKVAQSEQVLSVSVTALSELEVFASLSGRGTSSQVSTPGSLQAQTAALGMKLAWPVVDSFHLGGELSAQFQNELGGQMPLLKATSIGLRALASFDARELPQPAPFVARFNLGYLFDNSALTIEELEDARYAALSKPRLRANEQRNLVTRYERYALGINRVDQFTLGLGVDAPIEVAERLVLSPLLEWKFGVPVNRQAYDCFVPTSAPLVDGGVDGGDRCLGEVGASAWPMDLALGVRVVPPIRGVTMSLALDLGLTGSSAFVRELAPSSPFTLMLALGYDYDARP